MEIFSPVEISYTTLASLSIASVSCLTSAVIRSPSIGALGVDVTYRRGNTAFVNIYTNKHY